ncbi:MAG TPA: sulfatase [Thermoanaerobaculia bacterium]|nr:sulfatase [Thermoanaerobaculia bacterium]
MANKSPWPALALLVFLLLGCGGEAAPRQQAVEEAPLPRATRGYIVISIDTLRADHLGCYGYGRPTSPFLDSLARRATLFEEAYAQYPSTLVSHMSMFTGLHPREHGVFPPNSVLAPEVETLPEVFQRNGFRTGGFTEGGYVSGRFGFRRGFDEFAARDRNRDRPLEKTFGRGVRFLESLKPDDRFFLFLHTYAVHTPYDAPDPYREPFWPGEPPAGAIPATGPALTRHNAIGGLLDRPALDWLTALYDAGIRETDDVLRRFFADLERLGSADQVTVIVTSDHGEELQDHGRLNHTQLYREVLRVPLMIVHPDHTSAVRRAGVVQLIDLAPTLYELARLRPAGKPTGVSLARRLGRAAPPIPGTALSDNEGGERAVYRGESGKLESLLLFDPPKGDWISRRAAVDAPGGELRFEARSFREPRRLRVRKGREVLADFSLTPEWTPVRIPLTGPARLLLEADGCAAADPNEKREFRCQAFQVRGLSLTRVELYDVASDPGQQRDVSRDRTRETRVLLRDLLAFNPPPVAGAAPAPPLDPELESKLRALGYLQ